MYSGFKVGVVVVIVCGGAGVGLPRREIVPREVGLEDWRVNLDLSSHK